MNGVAFFQAQDDLTPKDLATLGTLLGANSGSAQPKESTLHIHPTQELGENGLPIGKISSKADKNGRQISFEVEDGSRLASASWHTDISFEKYPASYTLLRMVSFLFPQYSPASSSILALS